MWSWPLGDRLPEWAASDQLHIIGRVTLGHESPLTTHGYIEADMKMKADCLRRLDKPPSSPRQLHEQPSRILAFLRAL
jgi:hypothetical protein